MRKLVKDKRAVGVLALAAVGSVAVNIILPLMSDDDFSTDKSTAVDIYDPAEVVSDVPRPNAQVAALSLLDTTPRESSRELPSQWTPARDPFQFEDEIAAPPVATTGI